MSDGRREIYSEGMGPTDGPGQGGIVDGQTAEGDCPEGGTDPVGGEAKEGCIYFIETEDGKFIKIGFSYKVIRRMSDLGTVMPVRLLGYFPGSMETEEWLHTKFKDQRKSGEWFHSSKELRKFISMMGLQLPRLQSSTPQATTDACASNSDYLFGEKHPGAVAMAKLRAKKLTPERRAEIARQGGETRRASLTPEQRSEIARKAGLASGRGRKKASE